VVGEEVDAVELDQNVEWPTHVTIGLPWSR
jgi:hypothetical protein